MQGMRLYVPFRLQQWMPVQADCPSIFARTTYKPGIAGGQGSSPGPGQSAGDLPESTQSLRRTFASYGSKPRDEHKSA
ncbi:MAG: hypothetical protein IPO31_05880 [Candidatus Obscuribacter sp.]|nr:hypothetical protein [Candidatus Obscuribacter sp.]